MDLVFIELICWGGLVFFFWALKDGLSKVENDIESFGLLNNVRKVASAKQRVRFWIPEAFSEPIGSYGGQTIYRYVVIDGMTYQFDRVCPTGGSDSLDNDERCVAPGLVYLEKDNCQLPLASV